MCLAERVGFEPTEARASSVFKTGAFNRSATSPCLKRCFTPKRRTYDTTKNPACQPTGSFFSFFTPFSGDRPAFSQNLKIFSKNFNFPLAFFFDPCYYRQADIRVWRSLVSRLNGVQEALSSNLNTRTIGVSFGILRFFYCSFAAFLARLHESKRGPFGLHLAINMIGALPFHGRAPVFYPSIKPKLSRYHLLQWRV